MNRRMVRNTILSVGITAAATAALTTSAAQTRTGEGSYRRVDNWAQLPPGYAWGTMSAVAIDARGIWTTDRQAQLVLKFDTDGKLLF